MVAGIGEMPYQMRRRLGPIAFRQLSPEGQHTGSAPDLLVGLQCVARKKIVGQHDTVVDGESSVSWRELASKLKGKSDRSDHAAHSQEWSWPS